MLSRVLKSFLLLFTQIFCTCFSVTIPLGTPCPSESISVAADERQQLWNQCMESESLQSEAATIFSCPREQSVFHCRSTFPITDANNLLCKDPFISKMTPQLCTVLLFHFMKKDKVWCTVSLPGKRQQQKSIRSYFRNCWVVYASWLLLVSEDCGFLPSRSILKHSSCFECVLWFSGYIQGTHIVLFPSV